MAFGLVSCVMRSGSEERPCRRIHCFRVPRGSQHPPRSSSPGGHSFRGSLWGCPQWPPTPGSGQRLGETGTLQVLGGPALALGPPGRSGGLVMDSPPSTPDGLAHLPGGFLSQPRFTLAPTLRAGSKEVGLTLTPLPAHTPGGTCPRLPSNPFLSRGQAPYSRAPRTPAWPVHRLPR